MRDLATILIAVSEADERLARVSSTPRSSSLVAGPAFLIVAVAIFVVAYHDGGYSSIDRSLIAVPLTWAFALGVGFGVWPLTRPPAAALRVGLLVALFALWTVLSVLWADSAETVLDEFNRVALYLVVYCVAVVAAARASAVRYANAAALALCAVAAVSLWSRFFPGSFAERGLPEFLPASAVRLSFPVDYWNGLGILLALAVPLLLRIGTETSWPTRGLGVLPLPMIGTAIYLTSSRGAVVTAVVAASAYVALTSHRWDAVAVAVAGTVGSVACVWFVGRHQALVDGPISSVGGDGRAASLFVVLASVSIASIFDVATRLFPRIRLSRAVGRGAAVALVLGVLTAGLLSHPLAHFESFKRPPATQTGSAGNFVSSHLFSGNGSGRWQFWQAAVSEFESRPLVGHGAGSFAAWWAQHGTISYYVVDAHSLWLEVLGELGVVGFALLAAVFVLGMLGGVSRLRNAGENDRPLIAALLAIVVAYVVAAGIDWMWELTIVSVVAFASLGLLLGPATVRTGGLRAAAGSAQLRPTNTTSWARAAVLLVACGLICAHGIPLLESFEIQASQLAVQSGNGNEALAHASAARRIEPWASSPYLQLALIHERLGEPERAHAAILNAIERDRRNWRLWLVAARIEVRQARIRLALESLRHARQLNPRSPLFRVGAS